MEEIERIVRKYPERFTEEEKLHIKAAVSGRSSGYEIRQCDVCGNYMRRGYCFDDGSHYCSEECMEKDGLDIISMKKYTACYYGLEAEKLSKEVMSLPMPGFEAYCKEHGSQDSVGFYTEWDCPDGLISKLNDLRRRLGMRYVGCTDIGAVVMRDAVGTTEVFTGKDGIIEFDVVESAPEERDPVKEFVGYLWIYDDDSRIAVVKGSGAVYRVDDGMFEIVRSGE